MNASPPLSRLFRTREPSPIRSAGIRFAARTDGVEAVNVAIGNVSLPMHPAMQARMRTLGEAPSPFADGVVKYTPTVGTAEANAALLHIIASSGLSTEGLHSQITDGGSQAMELLIAGLCGPAGSTEGPLLLIDAAYTNYASFAERLGRPTVSVTRTLETSGKFTLPPLEEIEALITRTRPAALLVIPYDNPTGHYCDHATLVRLARLCVAHDLWLVSDEAYRELLYTGDRPSSVWGLTEAEVPGITGRRVSVESASKVWNACGLRIGGLVTDSRELSVRAVAENTASLCPSAIGQHIFGGLAHVPHAELQGWYRQQRAYYSAMAARFTEEMRRLVPGVIVSSPDASIYSVVDVRDVAPAGFDADAFLMYCAGAGSVDIDGRPMTLLAAPMAGFYSVTPGQPNPQSPRRHRAGRESEESARTCARTSRVTDPATGFSESSRVPVRGGNPQSPRRHRAGRESEESARTCARTSRVTDPATGFSESSRVPVRGGNPGRTQMRIAYVEPPDRMALAPRLLAGLLAAYL